ncbi:MAG TPA: cytochrome c oxidase subunit 3 family protein [Chloroflexota bacterium]|jgi:cytochrome c oxidase subunit 3|nr:cytochrome c oxidase subunit 3 family protein [Chloroflexota bacterium]
MIVEARPTAQRERAALGEQYNTLQQQHATAELGMWIFLATEIMLFGGLFTGYTVYRTAYPAAFAEGSRHLDLVFGTINTAVLIVSSLTMALAVRAAQLGQQRALVRLLLVTAVLGALFVGIKGVEWSKHYADGMVPQLAWQYSGPLSQQVQLFFMAYFVMTGLHAVHLTVGVISVLVMVLLARRGAFPAERHTSIEVLGLYWHFVDMIWIFLLPLLYLFGLG